MNTDKDNMDLEMDEEHIIQMPTDRIINTTDTNEYAEDLRDELVWEESLVDTEIPVDDRLSFEVDENGEGERPLYDENGYEDNDRYRSF